MDTKCGVFKVGGIVGVYSNIIQPLIFLHFIQYQRDHGEYSNYLMESDHFYTCVTQIVLDIHEICQFSRVGLSATTRTKVMLG